jgi:hypothetical protein
MQQQAQQIAEQLTAKNETQRYSMLAQLRTSNPDLYMLVNQLMHTGQAGAPGGGQTQGQLPEKLPPRAGPGRAMI